MLPSGQSDPSGHSTLRSFFTGSVYFDASNLSEPLEQYPRNILAVISLKILKIQPFLFHGVEKSNQNINGIFKWNLDLQTISSDRVQRITQK